MSPAIRSLALCKYIQEATGISEVTPVFADPEPAVFIRGDRVQNDPRRNVSGDLYISTQVEEQDRLRVTVYVVFRRDGSYSRFAVRENLLAALADVGVNISPRGL